MKYSNLLNRVTHNLQDIISGYQDITTIFMKLEKQGHIDKIGKLLADIFEEEQQFTITELRKFNEKIKPDGDMPTFKEQFILNTNIFRRNFAIILYNLANEISMSMEPNFDNSYSSADPARLENSLFINHTTTQDRKNFPKQQENLIEKAKDITYLEPIEESTSLELPSHQISVQTKEEPLIEKTSNVMQDQVHKSSNANLQRHSVNHNKPEKNTNNNNTNLKTNQLKYYLNQASNSKDKSSPKLIIPNQSRLNKDQNSMNDLRLSQGGECLSSRCNTDASCPKSPRLDNNTSRTYKEKNLNNMNESNKKNGQNLNNSISPSRFTHQSGSSNQKMQFTVISSAGIDPAVLDSEFSYTQGSLFCRSKRKLHDDDNKVPGPGFYEPESFDHNIKKKTPTNVFSKSPRVTYFDDVVKHQALDPGASYYPSIRFISR